MCWNLLDLHDADRVRGPCALPPTGDADDVVPVRHEAALLAEGDGVLQASVDVLGPVASGVA